MSAQAATVSSRTPWILNQHVADCVVFRSVTKVCRRISLRSASSFRRRRRRTFAASFDTSRLTAFSAQPAWVQVGHRWHKSLSAATFNAFGPRSLAAMEMQRHACAEARKQRASRPPELAVCKTLGSGCCTSWQLLHRSLHVVKDNLGNSQVARSSGPSALAARLRLG